MSLCVLLSNVNKYHPSKINLKMKDLCKILILLAKRNGIR
jgi:hypothetical protein